MFEPATDSRWAIGIQDFNWENGERRELIVMGTGQPQNPKNDKSKIRMNEKIVNSQRLVARTH